ncbi:erythromycin esterase family protein [Deinococcus cellulosilyticus]|uniref:Erythromycin esterase n=1 Tax=Deinococcus cellulosilyticus (strain DSM 18568 / NBRC 106333 / KACC 11606 / 5516J-15) TaxID=1223518 RepID=A0A511N240_DEIC1|nr:erythromycin esterase family protein [Deinococcus cellulosilyticus]GEM46919.1 erythromycin esterase [Deinococcus cellulosilyticus NBRC 106333 = KACC 11606]
MPEPTFPEIGWDLNDPGPALASFLDTLPESPRLLGLGEPSHTQQAYPLWRNQIFQILVQHHGYRSIALESDLIAGLKVDAYISGGDGDFEDVMQHGFSHDFGKFEANQELIRWMREFNTGRSEEDRLRFYGFDAPTESMWAPGPRHALLVLHDHLARWVPDLTVDRDTLLHLCGEEENWTNPAAAMDPTQSIGNSKEARELRWMADEMMTLLEVEGARLQVEQEAYWHAHLHARAAQGLLRYHALMATDSPHRLARLLTLRDQMMTDNLFSILEREKPRGPTLVFAHNQHLGRQVNRWKRGVLSLEWCPVGVHLSARLGKSYAFIATAVGQADGVPEPAQDTVEGQLKRQASAATLYATHDLLPMLASSLSERTDTAANPAHFPLKPEELRNTDGVLFLPDLNP